MKFIFRFILAQIIEEENRAQSSDGKAAFCIEADASIMLKCRVSMW